MWIAIVVVLLFNVLRLATVDYSAAGFDWVAAWLLAGLVIGFSEELLARGYVVRIMRSSGHSEVAVGRVSAALFALLHGSNLFTSQPLGPTLLQMVYTSFFGFCMYLASRVTRMIVAPILLHARPTPASSCRAPTRRPAASPPSPSSATSPWSSSEPFSSSSSSSRNDAHCTTTGA
ncbi:MULTISPECIES: CPBP family intramembrane glutamic endopeptidase [unclassified Curtobacterium]|uniref:CPBP family intramembrane glutamic endopeptidase n=1 Tax=unclassified Curtobacterium TaxID=257496 RepID=UPI000F4BCB96|nr:MULTISPECIES: CPBP family intramembrane glutamic endopeptidase [unclassified Curtobacterium]